MTPDSRLLESSSEIAANGPSGKPDHDSWPWWRRRRYLIDRKGQLLATAKITGVVLALLVLLNMVFALWSTIETQAIVATNPELLEEMTAIDRRTTMSLVVVSLVILVAVVVRSIMLTHRTAGAAFNLERCLGRVASGDYGTELRVRRKDNLKHLQEPFHQMMESLRRSAADDHAALSSLAGKLEEVGQVEIAEEARELAEAKAKLANPTS
jgi:methyl-accepting chemotaxis protein